MKLARTATERVGIVKLAVFVGEQVTKRCVQLDQRAQVLAKQQIESSLKVRSETGRELVLKP